jgi:hypothetical protein
MSGSPLDRLARSVKRGDQPAWIPRAPTATMYQGFVDSVNSFKGVVDFQLNDPSGLVIPGVRFLQSYSATNLPQPGHVVWVQHSGTDLIVLGQHVVPTDIVIP